MRLVIEPSLILDKELKRFLRESLNVPAEMCKAKPREGAGNFRTEQCGTQAGLINCDASSKTYQRQFEFIAMRRIFLS
jgi:hypothetical protein